MFTLRQVCLNYKIKRGKSRDHFHKACLPN